MQGAVLLLAVSRRAEERQGGYHGVGAIEELSYADICGPCNLANLLLVASTLR